MSRVTVHSIPAAHHKIIGGLHIALRLLEQFGTNLKWRRDTIARIKERGDQALALVGQPRSAPISFESYRDIAEETVKVARNAWSAMLNDSVLDAITPMVDELVVAAQNLDTIEPNDDLNVTLEDVPARMRALRDEVCRHDVSHLSPREKVLLEHDLRAIGAALDAVDTLKELESRNGKAISIPKLNVEFVNEAVLRSWMLSMAVQDALPEDPGIIHKALDHIEKYHHLDGDAKAELASEWAKQVPAMDERALEVAVGALMMSACSSRLQSLEYSSTDVVRRVVDSVYQEQARRRQSVAVTNQADDLGSQVATADEIQELMPMLQQLSRNLLSLEAHLGYSVTRYAVKDLRELVEKVNQKASALVDPDERVDQGPSLT